MHEYSLATSLLRIVEDEARAAHGVRVVRVLLRVGSGGGVEPDLLRTAWEAVRETDLCREAALDVEIVPERWVCALCHARIAPSAVLHCAACDAPAVLDGGDELVLQRIEVERATERA